MTHPTSRTDLTMPTGNEPPVGIATPPRGERRFSTPEFERAVDRSLVLAFAPIHKRVFGFALAIACALLVGGATMIAVLERPAETGIELLSVYFRGYDVSPVGIFVGAAWAGLVGFVAGWFLAFVRNFVLACWLLYIRSRASLQQARDFLDHI